MSISLTELPKGTLARVIAIDGGRHMASRLRAMGVTTGKIIRKLSALAAGGPLVVVIDRAQVAIGRGMAAKISVEPTETDNQTDPHETR